MSTFDEIRQGRIEKLNQIKGSGVEPYPIKAIDAISIKSILDSFSKLEKRTRPVQVAGRLMARREHGGSVFCDLYDGTGFLQLYFKKNEVGAESFKNFLDNIDIGDFISCKGGLFVTKKKEKTLGVKSWNILSKSLRSLPEKWHGLQDVEERYRRRYLDLLMNEGARDKFVLRSNIISEIRNFLNDAEFMEVETPILQPLAGGATAIPFQTHHNALDMDLYLRIAPELYLKMLLIGGMPKVYEIGRNFRNEGVDATHNPEFTMLEFYEAYSDAEKQREFVEKMFRHLVKKVFKKTSIEYSGSKISFAKKFATVSYYDLLKRYALIVDPISASKADLSITAKRFGINTDANETKDKILDNIYKKICRPKLIQPTFIVDYPADYLPLAKRISGSPDFVDAFQLVVGGIELVKGFSELNDPIDQRERFQKQDENRATGDAEAQTSDEEFLEAMEYGMPPAGGVGIGIDRLAMLLTDARNIREVVLFPTLRPKSQDQQ